MPKSGEELFAAALDLMNPVVRAELLERECAGNPALRAEVESLLAVGDLGTGWHWRDWIIARALISEAKALIEGQPAVENEQR